MSTKNRYPSPQALPQGVWQLDADYVTAGAASVYLIEQSGHVAIVETGTRHTVPHILEQLQVMGIPPEQVDYVIPTHVHLDHAAGAGLLMSECPNAQLVIHPRGAAHMIDPGKLEAGTRAVYGDDKYERLYGALVPVDASRVIEANDNHRIDFHGRTLTFLDTPGHARHHFCVHDSGSNGVFTGDTFGISYRLFDTADGKNLICVTTSPVHFDPPAMKQSIQRLADLNADTMYLTHYGPIRPTADNLEQLLDSLDAFVELARPMVSQPPGEQRKQRIAAGIREYLLQQAAKRCPHVSMAEAERWLAQDVELNAQGIEVWLSRQQS